MIKKIRLALATIIVLMLPSSLLAEETLMLDSSASLNQITNVSQLQDVSPGDWAYESLRQLVERYGCIAGYPNNTFQGNRALTRYEFAAGLNSCLKQVEKLIATGTVDLATKKEDLETLKRLTQEFQTELDTLGKRVDNLAGKVGVLENHQFSTTTKLNGQVIFAATDAFGDASRSGKGNQGNFTFSDRVRLTLQTSFTGKDLLRTRIQGTNIIPEPGPGNETRPSFQSGSDTNNTAFLSKLDYRFPVGKKVSVLVGTGFNTYFDDADVINPLQSDADGTISRFGRYSQIYRLGGDTGVGIKFKPNENLKAEMFYLAGNTNNPSSGLFNGKYGALGQIVFYPNKNDNTTKIAFTYVNAYNKDGLGHNTGSLPANLGGREVSSNSYGVEANVKITKGFQLGGWGAYTNARALTGDVKGDADIWSWAFTLGFPDLGKKGNWGGIIVGMQPKLTGTSAELSGLPRRDPDTGFHVEGFYRHKINDHISITPGLVWLTAPNHNAQNGNIFLGTIRTTFTF